jgi:arylsulfatase A
MKKPNIIYMLTDDLGLGDLSCYNPSSKLHTPRLDQVAAEGIQFNNAHATSALCSPSRYSLLTGRYNWRNTATLL